MKDIQTLLKSLIENTLTEVQLAEAVRVELEHPNVTHFGDFSTNIALRAFPKLSAEDKARYKTPLGLAEFLQEKLESHLFIKKTSVEKPGFINFTLSEEFFLEQLQTVLQKKGDVIEPSLAGKKYIVEYSSPNIAKPFTVGHSRSVIIGDAIANLLEASDAQVYRDNHLGDWGTQFGKQIYAIKTWGDEKSIETSAQPVKELVALYVKFHEEAEKNSQVEDEGRAWFKRLEEGDEEARRLWQKCVDWSWKEFSRIYDTLGVKFTENNGRGYGESYFEDKMGPVIQELEDKKLLKESEGAKLVFFPEDKLPPLMILKKDGATLYATRDLATDKFRLEKYGKDITVINEVGAEQSEYFTQLYEVEKMLGWYQEGQRVHVKHGHFRFKDKKMSTRKGNVIWLQDVITEAVTRAKELDASNTTDDHKASVIAVGALKWNDLKRTSHLDVVFDWDEVLTMNGNSGPYLQYTYARCQSVLAKAGDIKDRKTSFSAEMGYQPNEAELAVLRLLYQFNEVIQRAATEFAPHHVATYLFDFAQAYNTFYNQHSILSEENEEKVKEFRVQLTEATTLILQKGLRLLGIQTVEKM